MSKIKISPLKLASLVVGVAGVFIGAAIQREEIEKAVNKNLDEKLKALAEIAEATEN